MISIFDTPNRIYLASKHENFIDGNLYDIRDNRNGPFLLNYPQPPNWQNLSGWQQFFGFDKHSTQARITADFNPETCILEVSIEGKLPECQSLNAVMNGKVTAGIPGPFSTDQMQKSQEIFKIRQKYPIEL